MAMEQLNSMLLEMPALKLAVLVFQIYMRIILMWHVNETIVSVMTPGNYKDGQIFNWENKVNFYVEEVDRPLKHIPQAWINNKRLFNFFWMGCH